jgi:hypothetical protein
MEYIHKQMIAFCLDDMFVTLKIQLYTKTKYIINPLKTFKNYNLFLQPGMVTTDLLMSDATTKQVRDKHAVIICLPLLRNEL